MRLGKLLLRYRQSRDLTVREMAAEIGIGIATLSRIENGNGIDAGTLVRLLNWLMIEDTNKVGDGVRDEVTAP